MRAWLLGALGIVFLSSLHAGEVVVYGGTPGGIAAAISAARLGREVTLVEYHDHIGGMTTSGLGKSDIENRAMIGGLFKEFVAGVLQHYVKTYGAEHENTKLCQDGYYAEPHVAETGLRGDARRAAEDHRAEGLAAESGARRSDELHGSHRRESRRAARSGSSRRRSSSTPPTKAICMPPPARSSVSVANHARSSANRTRASSISTTRRMSFCPAPPARRTIVCPPTPTGSA